MIGALRGTVAAQEDRSLLVDVHGVFYRVTVTPATARACPSGKEATLYTHVHQRDEAPELFGFLTEAEQRFFSDLISVTGVGPKGALSIMTLAPVSELKQHIAQGDAALLTKVSGIGKKTAERLVLELKGKFEAGEPSGDGESATEVFEAMARLGYSAGEIRSALRSIDRSGSVEEQVRAALGAMRK